MSNKEHHLQPGIVNGFRSHLIIIRHQAAVPDVRIEISRRYAKIPKIVLLLYVYHGRVQSLYQLGDILIC